MGATRASTRWAGGLVCHVAGAGNAWRKGLPAWYNAISVRKASANV